MGSRFVIEQQASATGCVHWKHAVPYIDVVKRTAQTICTGWKKNIVVLESEYFFDYLCHWNWFLLSLLIFYLFLYIFFISWRVCDWQGTASGTKSHNGRFKKWHWQDRKVTQGPKCHSGVLQWLKIDIWYTLPTCIFFSMIRRYAEKWNNLNWKYFVIYLESDMNCFTVTKWRDIYYRILVRIVKKMAYFPATINHDLFTVKDELDWTLVQCVYMHSSN